MLKRLLARLPARWPFAVMRDYTELRWYRGCIALTDGRREFHVWWGRRDYGRGELVLGGGCRPVVEPDYSGVLPPGYAIDLYLPEIRLRWQREYCRSSEWTGREWRLYAWSSHPLRLRIERPSGVVYWPRNLPKLHLV